MKKIKTWFYKLLQVLFHNHYLNKKFSTRRHKYYWNPKQHAVAIDLTSNFGRGHEPSRWFVKKCLDDMLTNSWYSGATILVDKGKSKNE